MAGRKSTSRLHIIIGQISVWSGPHRLIREHGKLYSILKEQSNENKKIMPINARLLGKIVSHVEEISAFAASSTLISGAQQGRCELL